MIHVDEDRCADFGLDPAVVRRIARRLSSAATDARSLGLTVFGGSGTGSLRYSGTSPTGEAGSSGYQNTVAHLDGQFDGGDGGDVF